MPEGYPRAPDPPRRPPPTRYSGPEGYLCRSERYRLRWADWSAVNDPGVGGPRLRLWRFRPGIVRPGGAAHGT